MANNPFIVDNTIPGLGASDLASMMGATYVLGFSALAHGARPTTRRSARATLRKLGARLLRDLGLNRDAC